MIRELGFPDPGTFRASYERASAWLDGLGIPPERTVIGGFSQGAVMSYALGLGADRPRPAGVLALSGFIPTVEGFTLDLERPLPPIAIGHGTYDPVIGVEWGRQAKEQLAAAGADLLYREYPLPHTIDPSYLAELQDWVRQAVSAGSSATAASREPS